MRKLILPGIAALVGLVAGVGLTKEPAEGKRDLTVSVKEKDGSSRKLNPDDVTIESGQQKMTLNELVRLVDAARVYSYDVGAQDAKTKKMLPVGVAFTKDRGLASRHGNEYMLHFARAGASWVSPDGRIHYEWCDVEPSEVRIYSEGYKPVVRKVDAHLSETVDLEPEGNAQD